MPSLTASLNSFGNPSSSLKWLIFRCFIPSFVAELSILAGAIPLCSCFVQRTPTGATLASSSQNTRPTPLGALSKPPGKSSILALKSCLHNSLATNHRMTKPYIKRRKMAMRNFIRDSMHTKGMRTTTSARFSLEPSSHFVTDLI
jgi:hypothetical protein